MCFSVESFFFKLISLYNVTAQKDAAIFFLSICPTGKKERGCQNVLDVFDIFHFSTTEQEAQRREERKLEKKLRKEEKEGKKKEEEEDDDEEGWQKVNSGAPSQAITVSLIVAHNSPL